MKWSELENQFYDANTSGEEIEGYVTFTSDSFNKEYPWRSRTYRVSSNNKAFQPSKIATSIFGTSIDMTDCYVRLDMYMKSEKPWKVEDCGRIYFALTESVNNIGYLVGIYPSRAKLKDALAERVSVKVDYSMDALDEYFEKNGITDIYNAEIEANGEKIRWNRQMVFINEKGIVVWDS